MLPWTDADWARLRTLEGLGMVLVATCAPDHAKRDYPDCRNPGKVPINLATGYHLTKWTDTKLPTIDLDAFRRTQESRRRQGKALYGVGAVTGRPLADGRRLVSLDIDGEEGVADAKRLLGPNRAPTLMYRTGSGGWHLLYGVPPGDGPVPHRSEDGGHQGIALQGNGKQTVLPPSGHVKGKPYRWAGPLVEIADLPDALREWAGADRPAPAAANTPPVIPAGPARLAADVDRDLRLRGVPEYLRQAVAAPYGKGDRSGHCWSLTKRLLGYRVPDALLTAAARVPEWGYGAKYRSHPDPDWWLAGFLTKVRAERDAEVAAQARRMAPVRVARQGLDGLGRAEGMER